METTESDTGLLDREFEYRLNRMERAAQDPEPAKMGYGEHRRRVFEYVADLQRRVATLKAGYIYRPHGTYFACRACNATWWERDAHDSGCVVNKL